MQTFTENTQLHQDKNLKRMIALILTEDMEFQQLKLAEHFHLFVLFLLSDVSELPIRVICFIFILLYNYNF